MNELPDHDQNVNWLQVHHSAKAKERKQMIESLELKVNDLILDVGAGSGTWNQVFRDLEPSVKIVALDHSYEVLRQNDADDIIISSFDDLPTIDRKFDLIWCSNSLMYSEDPAKVLQKLSTSLKPSGRIVIKEEDSGRDILLPWPQALDLEVREAWHKICAGPDSEALNPYMGRDVPKYVELAGLSVASHRTYSMDRGFPFPDAVVEYVSRAFLDYEADYSRHLTEGSLETMIAFLDPKRETSIWHNTNAMIVFLEAIVVAEPRTTDLP